MPTSIIEYVDFEKMRRRIQKLLENGRLRKKTRVALQILLIQLLNGARLSEAYEAYYKWVQDPSRNEVMVRVRKKRRPEYRRIIIPEELTPLNINIHKISIPRVSRRLLGTNTHSLRYAYVTYLGLKEGLPPQIIAKITKHSKPELIEYYTQVAVAEEIQRKIARGKRRR